MAYSTDVSSKFAECRDVIHEAYEAALATVAPGVPGEAVDEARRRVLTRAGYGQYIAGRTGHGLGLETNEAPFTLQGNREPLQVGHVFTIEPGTYKDGTFGTRFEDTVIVTAEGRRVMGGLPAILPN